MGRRCRSRFLYVEHISNYFSYSYSSTPIAIIIAGVAGIVIFLKVRQRRRRRRQEQTGTAHLIQASREPRPEQAWKGPYTSRASYTRSPSPVSPAAPLSADCGHDLTCARPLAVPSAPPRPEVNPAASRLVPRSACGPTRARALVRYVAIINTCVCVRPGLTQALPVSQRWPRWRCVREAHTHACTHRRRTADGARGASAIADAQRSSVCARRHTGPAAPPHAWRTPNTASVERASLASPRAKTNATGPRRLGRARVMLPARCVCRYALPCSICISSVIFAVECQARSAIFTDPGVPSFGHSVEHASNYEIRNSRREDPLSITFGVFRVYIGDAKPP